MGVEITTEEGVDLFGRPTVTYSCPSKTKSAYRIQKSQDGFCFLEIVVVDGGVVPKNLETKATNEKELDRRIRHHFETMKTSTRAFYEEKYKDKPIPTLRTKKVKDGKGPAAKAEEQVQ